MTVSVKEQITCHITEMELKIPDNFEEELIKLPENSWRTILECCNSILAVSEPTDLRLMKAFWKIKF